MKLGKRIFTVLLVLATLLGSFGFTMRAKAQEVPQLVSILTTAAVRVDQKTISELFDFTTDLRNDYLYWGDAVAGTQLIRVGDKGIPSAGTQYEQQGEWVGYPFHNIIDVTRAKQTGDMRFIEFESHSLIVDGLEYHAVYQFEAPVLETSEFGSLGCVEPLANEEEGAVFIVTAVSTSYGITEEQMIGWHNFALSNYLTYHGSTGEILWNYSKTVGAPTIEIDLTNYEKIIREYML